MVPLFKTKEEIEAWLQACKIKNYTIAEDLSVSVRGNVMLIHKIKGDNLPVQFDHVSGDFTLGAVGFNTLKTLKGCPRVVGGNFICNCNEELISLEGGPQEVLGNYDCSLNKLRTLKGSPQTVKGSFNCGSNYLTNLEGGPTEVGLDYECSYNDISSLKGLPKVMRSLIVNFNQLENLKGCPTKLNILHCFGNKLISLEGCPQEVESGMICDNNKLSSLEYFPQSILTFSCKKNKKLGPIQKLENIEDFQKEHIKAKILAEKQKLDTKINQKTNGAISAVHKI